ncbi:MAG: hypothetical protein WA913_10505 [Pricia sp.]
MKNTAKYYVCCLILALCAGTALQAHGLSAKVGHENNVKSSLFVKDNLIGGWSYTVEGAPEGYQNGLMIIVKDGDAYKVQIQIGGNTLLGENVKVSGNTIEFEVMVEEGRVSVGLTAKGDTISGKSTSQEGTYNIKGEKTLSME